MHPGLYALLATGLALSALALLLQLKVKIGRAMVGSALVQAWLLGVTPVRAIGVLCEEWETKELSQTTGFLFLTLTGLVLLVNVLGGAMQETGVARRLGPAMQRLFRSRRAAMSLIPLMMGMLPTPGGIMLSAPMVRELGDASGVGRARQAAINFFFRHQLEAVWPLFPSVPLVQAMFQIPPARLLAYNSAIGLSGLVGGVIFLLTRGFGPARTEASAGQDGEVRPLRDFAQAFWPIGTAAACYVVFNLPAAVGILVAIVVFLLAHRVPFGRWGHIFRSAMEWDFVLLIFGALVYKLNLDAADSVAHIAAYLQARNVPLPVLIFSLPFLVGYLTGVTMPTVAMTFPLLKAFIGEGPDVNMGYEVLAFAGVLVGLFVTPVHLCLALSVTYFGATLGRILALVVPPTLVVTAVAFLMGFVFG